MKPYYQEAGITIYHADSRSIGDFEIEVEAVITDPVWPNCEHIFPGIHASELLQDTLDGFICRRIVKSRNDTVNSPHPDFARKFSISRNAVKL